MSGLRVLEMIPTKEEHDYVKQLLSDCNVAQRGSFDGDKERQYVGMLGQVVISDFLQLPRPTPNQGWDGGFDIIWQGKKYDIKCERRTVRFNYNRFVHNLVGKQCRYQCDGYIFLSYNQTTGVFDVCGSITKQEFLKHARFYPEGTARERTNGTKMIVHQGTGGMYEIEQRHLSFIYLDGD